MHKARPGWLGLRMEEKRASSAWPEERPRLCGGIEPDGA